MRRVLLGFKHRIVPVPWFLFIRILRREAKKTKRVLGGLDDEHRRVHHFVVKNLPSLARPMPPDFIADRLKLDEVQIIQILDELERRLIFLLRHPASSSGSDANPSSSGQKNTPAGIANSMAG